MEEKTLRKIKQASVARLEAEMSNLEADIRTHIRFISMVQTIMRRIEIMRDRVNNAIEIKTYNLRRLNNLIKIREASMARKDLNILFKTEELTTLKAANSVDSEFLYKLEEMEEQSDSKMDIVYDMQKVQTIKDSIKNI